MDTIGLIVLGTVADDNSRMGAGPVLVVDDYEAAAESTCRLLGIIGHASVACTDATKCVEIAKQIQPGAVLLDIQMPVISGLELVGPLRAVIGPDCKIVAVTGHVDRTMEQRCLSAGFDAFIIKPTILSNLEAVIGSAGIRNVPNRQRLNPSSSPDPKRRNQTLLQRRASD